MSGADESASGLDAHVVVERPAFRLDVSLTARPGEVVALLGPNGAGKTTALRALAGLVPLDAGAVHLDSTVLESPAGRVRLAPERRPIGVVFQDYLLFPHLSALENVAFGPRSSGTPRRQARAEAAEWLARVGLSDHTGARPRALSGGQAQRVALARALAVRPRLLLLDEPLAALDARTRVAVRSTLRSCLEEFEAAAVLVTHDALDAMVLADRLVVVEDGRIVQEGPPAQVARHPRTDYVARLVGLNLFRGVGRGHVVDVAGVPVSVVDPVDGDAFVSFAPSAVALFRERPSGSPRNVWPATVEGLEPHGDTVRVDLAGGLRMAADVTPWAVAELALAPGATVWVSLKATETRAYPA